MADHDQRLKNLLREFLAELVALMLPDWVGRHDLSAVRWLEQEVFGDPPRGERRELDLVARVGLLQQVEEYREGLIHIEVESGDSVADLRRRMPRYHDYLGYKHELPVLSLAVYLGVGLQGRGWDENEELYWGESLGRTRWPYLGLPALDAVAHVEGENLLGVALSVLMRVDPDRAAWLKARAMQRVATAELTAYRRYLLMECIEAYAPLDGPHLEEFHRLLLTEDFKEARMLAKTSFERGKEEGLVQGERSLIRRLLEAQFGPLSPTASQRLEQLPPERLETLGLDLLQGRSLMEMGLEDPPPSNGE
jgi:Domain of unknown function (DUF4351)